MIFKTSNPLKPIIFSSNNTAEYLLFLNISTPSTPLFDISISYPLFSRNIIKGFNKSISSSIQRTLMIK